MNYEMEYGSLTKISGPVSWYGYRLGQSEIHIFGDIHGDTEFNGKMNSCEPCHEKDCLIITELIDKIIKTSEKKQIHCDVFVEASIGEFDIDEIAEYPEGYLPDVIDLLKKGKSGKYTKKHTIDTRRLNLIHSYDPFIILYDELDAIRTQWLEDKNFLEQNKEVNDLNISQKINSNIDAYISGLLNDVYQIITLLKKYVSQQDTVEILNQVNGLFEKYKTHKINEKYIVNLLGKYKFLLSTFKDDKMNLYIKTILELYNKEPNLASQLEHIVREYIEFEYQIVDEQFKNNRDNLEYLFDIFMEFLFKVSVYIMDIYTFMKIILTLKVQEEQVIIYYGGAIHASHVDNFISSIPNIISLGSIDKQEEKIRCLTNSQFGDIFGVWLK